MTDRKSFLKSSATVVSAALLRPSFAMAGIIKSAATKVDLQLGIAGYSFIKLSVEDAITITRQTGITAISIKDKHIPINTTKEEAVAIIEKFKKSGINIYAAGMITMKTEQDIDRAFNYAKNIGVGMIIASPNISLLKYVEQKVMQYNIKIAIHNGGPEDKWYPTPKAVFDNIKNYDNRIGLCFDTGHTQRAGVNPIEAYNQYAEKILDIHLKDVEAAKADAQEVELGRGIIDIQALVSSLYKHRYSGRCSIEYQKNLDDPLEGIAESVGYFKGVCKALKAFEKA